MKLKKKIQPLFHIILMIFTTPSAAHVNFKKLKLKEFILKNNLTKTITLSIDLDDQCSDCKDVSSIQKNIILSPLEYKKINYNDQIINNITSLDQSTDFFFERTLTNLKHTLHIVDKRHCKDQSLPFIELSFDDTMQVVKSNKAYQSYLNKKIPKQVADLLPKNITVDKLLTDFKALYEKNRLSKVIATSSSQSKTPFIIHQIWFGITGDMPHLYKQWQKTYRKKHPAWRFICWNGEMIKKKFPKKLFNQNIFDEASINNAYACMADLARYEIIYKFGGFYTDSDAECFESLEPLNIRYDFFTSLEPISHFPLGCTLNAFGAKPHHPILQACIVLCKHRADFTPAMQAEVENLVQIYKKKYIFFKTMITTGPYLFLTGILAGVNKENNCDIIFPNNYCGHWFTPTLESFCYHHVILPTLKKNNNAHWSNITHVKG